MGNESTGIAKRQRDLQEPEKCVVMLDAGRELLIGNAKGFATSLQLDDGKRPRCPAASLYEAERI